MGCVDSREPPPEAQIERWVFPKAAVISDDKGAKALSQFLGKRKDSMTF